MSIPLEAKLDDSQPVPRARKDKVRQLVVQDEDSDDEPGQETQHRDDDEFELDGLNKHPCMQNILYTLDTLSQNFAQSWEPSQMPSWMQRLHSDYAALNSSAKLFVLKLIVNRPNIFVPYAEFWFEYLAEYVTAKDTGGKGLHYFMRDI